MKFLILLFLLFQLVTCYPKSRDGVAFAFSGAGGRIAQHLALMESLVKGLNPSGIKVRPHVISGASSGSISAVALNAILYNEDHNLTDFTWDDYKQLIFGLSNSQVYDDSVLGRIEIFTVNIEEGYILDNTPLLSYMASYLQQMNLNTLGDLYLPTEITVVNQSNGESIRLWSDDPQYMDLPLLDVIMASTSIPVAFPPRTISGLGDALFIDGGTGIDTLPVYSLLNHANVSEIYVICYGGAFLSEGGGDLPSELSSISILKNAAAAIESMRADLFNGGVDMLTYQTSVPSWLYMPTFPQTYSALDFDNEFEQYNITHFWALNNIPVPIN